MVSEMPPKLGIALAALGRFWWEIWRLGGFGRGWAQPGAWGLAGLAGLPLVPKLAIW